MLTSANSSLEHVIWNWFAWLEICLGLEGTWSLQSRLGHSVSKVCKGLLWGSVLALTACATCEPFSVSTPSFKSANLCKSLWVWSWCLHQKHQQSVKSNSCCVLCLPPSLAVPVQHLLNQLAEPVGGGRHRAHGRGSWCRCTCRTLRTFIRDIAHLLRIIAATNRNHTSVPCTLKNWLKWRVHHITLAALFFGTSGSETIWTVFGPVRVIKGKALLNIMNILYIGQKETDVLNDENSARILSKANKLQIGSSAFLQQFSNIFTDIHMYSISAGGN